MKNHKLSKILGLILCFLLLPWMFFATIPDILYPATPYSQTVMEPAGEPVPAEAPIQIQYEAMDLNVALDWVKQYYPNSVIDLPMLQAFDRGAQVYNVSLGLMLGILNAEHSMLSGANLAGQYNPFSYGWTDETHTNIDWTASRDSNVERSTTGSASIVATVANSLIKKIGQPDPNDGSPWLTSFITLLGNYYVTGRPIYDHAITDGIYNVPNWINNVAPTTMRLYKFATEPARANPWVHNIQQFAAIGGSVLGVKAATLVHSKVLSIALPAMYMGYQKFLDGWDSTTSFISKIPTKDLCIVGIAVVAVIAYATGIGEIATVIGAGIEGIIALFGSVMAPIIESFSISISSATVAVGTASLPLAAK